MTSYYAVPNICQALGGGVIPAAKRVVNESQVKVPPDTKVRRCRLIVSKPVLKASMASALEAIS
jgi:hypothetical protein